MLTYTHVWMCRGGWECRCVRVHTYTHVWMCRGGWECRCVIVNVYTCVRTYTVLHHGVPYPVLYASLMQLLCMCISHEAVRLCNECILSPSSADPVVPADV